MHLGPPPATDQDVRAALLQIIASRQFAKAHRCIALLTYLVQQTLAGEGPPSEYDIGLAVFRRDPRSYFTGEDPIVRVQMGRLRLRLAAYYRAEGRSDPLRVSLPVGSYRPRLERGGTGPLPSASRRPALTLRPLDCLSHEMPAQTFTLGLSDELAYRLHRDLLDPRLTNHEEGACEAGIASVGRVLEGTVRMDASRVRLSLRLRHGADGDVVWHQQFDCAVDGSIAAQEQLADRCVQALPAHMR